MPELPGGVVTFVFTDVEGSTRLFRALGDRYPELLETHRDLVRAVWRDHGGVEVGTEGDSFFVAFADASAAVRAGVAATAAIEGHRWPDDGRFRIRVGMHTGMAFPRDGAYIAFPVHQAARIGALGHGGQVVLSPATRALVDAGDGCRLRSLGRYRVRDFDEPIEIHQADGGGDGHDHPPLKAPADERHNLRTDLPELIGRDDDLDGVTDQLAQARLVTVVGPGGVGKTAFATAVAARCLPRHPDGVWFVDLASATSGAEVTGRLADVLETTSEALPDDLAGQRALIVLDNCEQAVGEIADVVARLGRAAPEVVWLATSREPLGLHDERLWRLGPLSADGGARDLFVARARAVDPGFDPDRHGASLDRLCEALDGLPLALELAAARVSMLSPAEIHESLDGALRVLRSRRRDIDERQRSAENLVAWSYRLLDDEEQTLLRRVSLFSDRFDAVAAAATMADDGLDAFDTADLLWSLVEKSLVTAISDDGPTTYRLLITTRAFAEERRRSGDDASAACDLARWYVERFHPSDPWSAATQTEIDEQRRNLLGLVPVVAESDLDLAHGLLWVLARWFRDQPARGLLELTPLADPLLHHHGPATVGLLASLGALSNEVGDPDAALARVAAADARPGAPADPGRAAIEAVRVWADYKRGRIAEGLASAEAALAARGDGREVDIDDLSLLGAAAVGAAELGDAGSAEARFVEIVTHAERIGAAPQHAISVGNLAEMAHRRGDLAEACRLTAESLRRASEMQMARQIALSVVGAAWLLVDLERWDVASATFADAERVLANVGIELFGLDVERHERARAALTAAGHPPVAVDDEAAPDTLGITTVAIAALEAVGESVPA